MNVIKDLSRILVIVNVNVINIVMLVEYLDYENCKCRKKLVDKLVEECTENIEETRLVEKNLAKNKNKHKYSSFTLYIVLFLIIFIIDVGIGIYFTYFYWYIKKIFHVLSLILALRQQFSKLINGRSQRNKYKKLNILFF